MSPAEAEAILVANAPMPDEDAPAAIEPPTYRRSVLEVLADTEADL